MLSQDYSIKATDEELEVADSNDPCVVSERTATLIRSSFFAEERAPVLLE
jgi:hypothetical protein